MSEDLREKARRRRQAEKIKKKTPTEETPKSKRPGPARDQDEQPGKMPLRQDKEPIARYDTYKGGYWVKSSVANEYVPLSEASVRRILKHEHYDNIRDKETNYALCDRHLMMLQREHGVSYAGPLAGYKAGLHVVKGSPILVTTGPKLIVPKEGKWATLKKFFGELFGESLTYVFAWLKASLRTLYAGVCPFRPAPMLAIAGPANCGKSLFQNIVTEIFGNRAARPYKYLIGETNFNGNLFGAEHLMIEDDANQTDLKFRRAFGANLKNLVFNETQSMRRMYRDELTVSVFTRVTITLNNEPENLCVLPPIDDSLADKISLLLAFMATFPFGKDDLKSRQSYRQRLTDELPAFLAFLRSWRVPERFQNQRCGVIAHQDAELMRDLHALAPESTLWELINKHFIWKDGVTTWSGSASELKTILVEKDKSGQSARLLEWVSACGTYLGRLEKKYPDRISKLRHEEWHHEWFIKPPPLKDKSKVSQNKNGRYP